MLLLVFKQENCISQTVLCVNTKSPFRPWQWQQKTHLNANADLSQKASAKIFLDGCDLNKKS